MQHPKLGLRICKQKLSAMTDDWSELRLVLAVARAGGLTGAAQVLGIDHSTAFRLQAIENRLGQSLFERLPGGAYEPSPLAARMAAAAERMEDEALALARDLAGRDHRLVGRLRVTSSETLAYRILTPHLAAFRRAHPGIAIELTIDNRVLSLTRREADVALRPLRPKQGDLWGRKLADIAWTVYGANTYLETHGTLTAPADLKSHAVIAWEETAAGINVVEWLASTTPASAVVYRTNSLINQLAAARTGIGLAVLPCYLGDPEPELVRALARPVPELERELWIVTHTDLRRTARVRAFFDVVGEGLAAERALFEGRARHRASKGERPPRKHS
jgi:DNA-binding transcriptional LysR family regulator